MSSTERSKKSAGYHRKSHLNKIRPSVASREDEMVKKIKADDQPVASQLTDDNISLLQAKTVATSDRVISKTSTLGSESYYQPSEPVRRSTLLSRTYNARNITVSNYAPPPSEISKQKYSLKAFKMLILAQKQLA